MKKVYFALLLIIIIAGLFWAADYLLQKNQSTTPAASPMPTSNETPVVASPSTSPSLTPTGIASTSAWQPPLDRAGERVTKKYFGIYITPQNSPVQPERFTGYHTGADFEIFPEELNAIVPVRAICSGQLKLKEYASGYGGVAVQACQLDNSPVTVIYGHLKLASITPTVGENITVGETIGVLGADKSVETDGERKHLHLGIHRGSAVNILGYVASQTELQNWIDPCLYVCHN